MDKTWADPSQVVLQKYENEVQTLIPTTQEIQAIDVNESSQETIKYAIGYTNTDDGNCKRIVTLHGSKMRWVEAMGHWFIWNGVRWVKDENGEAIRRAKETAKSILQEAYQEQDHSKSKKLTDWAFRSHSRQSMQAALELAKSEPGITVPLSKFDKDPYILNFRNGSLDLKTATLMPHNLDNYITKLIDLDYDPNAKCPRWMQFLDEITNSNPKLIDFLQRAIGYSLTGITTEQVFFICYGKGANGKSVFLETILNMLGSDYAVNTTPKTILIKDRSGGANNDVARLCGSRFVSINEIPGRGKLDEAKVKEFTGGDTITARFLFQEEFSFKPEFKLWVRTNHKPVIQGVDHGMWRRVRLIPFTVMFPQDKQDSNLFEKLREEWEGIITWAVLGCLAWIDEGLQMPDEVKAATQEYKVEQDTMQPFIDDCCRTDRNVITKSSDLYAAYKTWAEANGERAMTSTAFGREMTERGFEKTRTPGEGKIAYIGICLKS